jgi:hypothetical protein
MADGGIVQKDEIDVVSPVPPGLARKRDVPLALLPDCAPRCPRAKVADERSRLKAHVSTLNTTG